MPISLNTFLDKSSASVPFLFRDEDARGGFRVVSTIADRGSIHVGSKKQGMLVYVIEDDTYYKLESDLTSWSEYQPTPASHNHDADYSSISHTHTAGDVGAYTTAETDGLISSLVDGAPVDLNTLNKIATSLNNDPAFHTTITSLLASKSDNTHNHDETYALIAHGHSTATQVVSGYMSSADKTKLDSTGDVITRNVGTSVGDVMEVGAFGLGATAIVAVDADILDVTGTYYLASDANGVPESTYVLIDHRKYDANHATQHAQGTAINKSWTRSKIAGVWGTWKVVTTEDILTTSLASYDTSSQVDAKIAALVESAPETLDTLNELAAALGDDPNFATTITNQIATKANALTYLNHTNTDNGTTLPDVSVNVYADMSAGPFGLNLATNPVLGTVQTFILNSTVPFSTNNLTINNGSANILYANGTVDNNFIIDSSTHSRIIFEFTGTYWSVSYS